MAGPVSCRTAGRTGPEPTRLLDVLGDRHRLLEGRSVLVDHLGRRDPRCVSGSILVPAGRAGVARAVAEAVLLCRRALARVEQRGPQSLAALRLRAPAAVGPAVGR